MSTSYVRRAKMTKHHVGLLNGYKSSMLINIFCSRIKITNEICTKQWFVYLAVRVLKPQRDTAIIHKELN